MKELMQARLDEVQASVDELAVTATQSEMHNESFKKSEEERAKRVDDALTDTRQRIVELAKRQ